MSTKHEQALHHLRAVLGFREGTTSYESAVAAMEKFLESEFAPPTKYTVFCRESSNQGTTWIDTVEVANGGQSASELLAEIRALATAAPHRAGHTYPELQCLLVAAIPIAITQT